MADWFKIPQPVPYAPRSFAPLIATLDRLGIDHVYADYWIAYRLDFATQERIIAAENTFVERRLPGRAGDRLARPELAPPRLRAAGRGCARPRLRVLPPHVPLAADHPLADRARLQALPRRLARRLREASPRLERRGSAVASDRSPCRAPLVKSRR